MSFSNNDEQCIRCSEKNEINSETVSVRVKTFDKKRVVHKTKLIWPQKPRTSKYYTFGRGVDETNKKPPEARVTLPKEELLQAYNQHRKRIRKLHNKLQLSKKYNEKIPAKFTRDFKNNLYVEEPTMGDITYIGEVAPAFYHLVEDRPVLDRTSTPDYIKLCRNVLMTKIVTGFRTDDVSYLYQKIYMQQRALNAVTKELNYFNREFENCMSKDHQESMELVKEVNISRNLIMIRQEEYLKLSQDFAKLKAQFYILDKTWNELRSFQHFLFSLSPIEWRKIHQEVGRRRLTITDVIMKENLFLIGEDEDLEDLIENYLTLVEKDYPLYFQKPEELISYYNLLNERVLETIISLAGISSDMDNLEEAIAVAEKLFKEEIQELLERFTLLSEDVVFLEQKAVDLEKQTYDIMDTAFKDMVASDDVLTFFSSMEDAYESAISVNRMQFKADDLLQRMEIFFLRNLSQLDNLPKEILAKEEKQYYLREMHTMLKAVKAEKMLKEFEILATKLKVALEPPYQRHGRELKFRSRPYSPPKIKTVTKRSLTKEEKMYLEYFTVYNGVEETLPKYGIDLSKSPMSDFPWHKEEKELF